VSQERLLGAAGWTLLRLHQLQEVVPSRVVARRDGASVRTRGQGADGRVQVEDGEGFATVQIPDTHGTVERGGDGTMGTEDSQRR